MPYDQSAKYFPFYLIQSSLQHEVHGFALSPLILKRSLGKGHTAKETELEMKFT